MMTKKHAATLLILLVGLTGLVNAQMSTTFRAQAPFDFVANGKTMPAGECTIALLGIGRTVLSISSGEQHLYAISIPDQTPKASKQTTLVFHRYGDRYFLAGIKRAGGTGYELPMTRLEAELRAGNVSEEVFTLLASAK